MISIHNCLWRFSPCVCWKTKQRNPQRTVDDTFMFALQLYFLNSYFVPRLSRVVSARVWGASQQYIRLTMLMRRLESPTLRSQALACSNCPITPIVSEWPWQRSNEWNVSRNYTRPLRLSATIPIHNSKDESSTDNNSLSTTVLSWHVSLCFPLNCWLQK